MLSHLRVWGCPAYVKHLKTDKLGPKSDRCLFVGYPKEIKRYYFYFTTEQKVFVSSRAVFLKKKFLGKETDATKVEFDEVRQIEELTQSNEPIESNLIRSNPKPIIEVLLRRSDKVPYPLDRYFGI